MTVITQNLRRTAQSAVSVAGFTLTAPAGARKEPQPGSIDFDHRHYPSPTGADALENRPLGPTKDIGSNGANARALKPADQPQSYAAALKDAYARIEICQNPALAALAANIAKLAEH